MERLDFSEETTYNAVEASIHLNRYAVARPFCQGAHVLDAACGEGYGSYLMKTWGAQSVTGVDNSEYAINRALNYFKDKNLNYIQHDVLSLPFDDHTFDLIVSLETIEHVNNSEEFLREIKRVLKPGGTIILSCPNDNYYYEKDNLINPFHKKAYNFFEFKEMAERYLGSYVEYFLAFALDGFINLPYEKRTEPESSVKEDAFGMFHYEICDQTLCIPQAQYLNQWNCHYYLGIWGRSGNTNRYSAVITPRDFFIDHKDMDYDLLHHLDEVREEMEKLRKNTEENSHSSELEKLKKKCMRMTSEQEKLHMELERLKLLLDLRQKERNEAQIYMHQNWDLYQQAIEQVNEIRSSRGMRIMEKYYSLRDKIKRIFRK